MLIVVVVDMALPSIHETLNRPRRLDCTPSTTPKVWPMRVDTALTLINEGLTYHPGWSVRRIGRTVSKTQCGSPSI